MDGCGQVLPPSKSDRNRTGGDAAAIFIGHRIGDERPPLRSVCSFRRIMPASDWRSQLYSHEPRSRVGRTSRTRGARSSDARTAAGGRRLGSLSLWIEGQAYHARWALKNATMRRRASWAEDS